MLLNEIIKDVIEYEPSYRDASTETFAGLSDADLSTIIRVSAQVQALEEVLSCMADQPQIGARYMDLIRNAKELGFDEASLATLRGSKPHLPFFISSLGPHIVNVVDAFFSTGYYREQDRTGPKDRDAFSSYYRTSTGTGLGLDAFSLLSEGTDVIAEVLMNALGFDEASTTTMPEHLSLPHLGLMTEASAIGSQTNVAACMAMGLGPLLRGEEMSYAEDAVVHLLIGDAGVNEPNFRNAWGMLENHMALIARHFLELDEQEVALARGNPERQREMYLRLREQGLMVRFATHVFDNGIGISCKSDVVHPFGDPLSSIRHLEQNGLLKIFEYDAQDFLSVLRNGKALAEEARKGPVAALVQCRRPGGHSLSNFYGYGKVREGRERSPTGSLTLEEAIHHNNTDPLLNAVRTLIDHGKLNAEQAVSLLRQGQREVIERVVDIVPRYAPKKSLQPIRAYTKESAEESWSGILKGSGRRDEIWKSSHFEHLSKKPAVGFKPKEGMYLPEHLGKISPLQAENFSLADIAMLTRLMAVGQDVPDVNPFELERVLKDPMVGTGGINKVTAGLQVLCHMINPETGRYQVMDIGINEAGIYAMGAGLKHVFGEDTTVLVEIQFNDYDFPLFALDLISSLYQRSNGKENIPIIIRQSYGFLRGRSVETIFTQGGASGTYHSSAAIGSLANRYPGLHIVAPNTSREVQMAYRNAVAGRTPTVVLMSNPVIRKMSMGSFEYEGPYLPLDTPLDPVGQARIYDLGQPAGSHGHVILTYGEYVPVSHMVAEELQKKENVQAMVVDYTYLVPRDRKVIPEILTGYDSDRPPHFYVVSQEGEFGFGSVIINDLLENGVSSDKIHPLLSKNRKGGWLEEHLVHPTPQEIYSTILASDDWRATMAAAWSQ